MNTYFAEFGLDQGFELLSQVSKKDGLFKGQVISGPSGLALFESLRGTPIKCWSCGCEAVKWISRCHRNTALDKAPVLNLYAKNKFGVEVMMTRDHIIPKSLGGLDSVPNLRPACQQCNEARGNEVLPEVIKFAKEHPELVSQHRVEAGLLGLANSSKILKETIRKLQADLVSLEKPFRDMGYL